MSEGAFDFIVVGSGAAGLVGAIAASRNGLRPLIIEKADVWGGTTATSGGVLWIPCNDLMIEQGAQDTAESARTYLHNLIGAGADERATSKADAFLESAPQMARMLTDEGFRWFRTTDHPDYYPDVPGSGVGRTMESARFDGRRLGERFRTMRLAELDLPAINSGQFGSLTRAWTSPGLLLDAARTAAGHKVRTWLGQKPLGNGRALAAALMEIVLARKIPVRLSTRLVDLIVEHGQVSGVVVESGGRRERLEAPAGVLLAAGGFARNTALRKQLQDRDQVWTNAIPEDEGDAFQIATGVGAATELTDDCWWMPSIQVTPEQNGLALGLRALPGSIIVNAKGQRYMNEARSYMTTGKAMYDHGAGDERHWMIMDGKFLKRYIFAELSQKAIRQQMMANGYLKQAPTIPDLARECGIDPAALDATVTRFNGFAASGKDSDFGRGDSVYDRYWADPGHRPNASLGEIVHPPYWAAVVRPGDLGTNGGLKTDQNARVLDGNDQPIVGLYAAGNGSGSPFARSYPGAGATIASAATFGYLAALSAAGRSNNRPA
ncbi:FAD-dependent oxidoreductase [Novosphingobium album (ex Hu et al. 2023)]|uniref:FAD-dependent oxidoreductase n=1 Tax=Novosphingobium album (ex Hu et al. 2023) TaxID=2930093 RepID=A0ABT0B108_9SPHN|nr:FAD-dependent oxidoreductase [Novosphingobium album (ex Hu et al. 2023)]MCJ2178761.1 FAD-dependent oxidoreductase [Novosphingobium album (ex Hu et al. 2023)]